MDRTHAPRGSSRHGRVTWGAAVLYIAWVLLWQHPGEVPTDIMILMFILAMACTQTLSGMIRDRNAGNAGCAIKPRDDRAGESGKSGGRGRPRTEKDPNVARAERIIEALHDMAESLKTLSRPEANESRVAVSSPPRLVRSGEGCPDRPETGTGGVAPKFSVIDGDR